MKKVFVILWITVLASAICFLFWYNDIVYLTPTPVPTGYKDISAGTRLPLNNKLPVATNKPVFLHFFNPDCPCSKFNMQHFKSLVSQYGKQVSFVMVVMAGEHSSAKQIQDKYKLSIPVVFDTSIATICGVYSTPQAAIINTDETLFYRGNYNKSRYCTDKKTNYAQQALEALLTTRTQPVADRAALVAYGCSLPKCSK